MMADALLNELQGLIARHAGPEVLSATALPGLMLLSSGASSSSMYIAGTLLAVVAQGEKEVFLGKQVQRYGPCQYMVLPVDLPLQTREKENDDKPPLLGLCFTLERQRIAELLTDSGEARRDTKIDPPLIVSDLEDDVLSPIVRYLRLLDNPEDIPILAKSIEREILWRLLRGPQGGMVRQFALADSRINRISDAIRWIRENFERPIRLHELAATARMSVTSFHRNFQAATSLSPIQYQKQIRLHVARSKLMAGDGNSIADISFSVGFNSPSQFSREYRRLFGQPPSNDVLRSEP